jgi:hypothetical protein
MTVVMQRHYSLKLVINARYGEISFMPNFLNVMPIL